MERKSCFLVAAKFNGKRAVTHTQLPITAFSALIFLSYTSTMDEQLVYKWNAGSVPPPHYFEVRIVIDPNGSGTLECRPDYEFNAPPVWMWSFTVPREILDKIDSKIAVALGRVGSEEMEKPNIGGPTESITVMRANQTIQVPITSDIVSAIHDAVGKDIWTQMRNKHDQYVGRASQ